MLHNKAQHNTTAQHTAQHTAPLHSTAQHSTAQHSTTTQHTAQHHNTLHTHTLPPWCCNPLWPAVSALRPPAVTTLPPRPPQVAGPPPPVGWFPAAYCVLIPEAVVRTAVGLDPLPPAAAPPAAPPHSDDDDDDEQQQQDEEQPTALPAPRGVAAEPAPAQSADGRSACARAPPPLALCTCPRPSCTLSRALSLCLSARVPLSQCRPRCVSSHVAPASSGGRAESAQAAAAAPPRGTGRRRNGRRGRVAGCWTRCIAS